MKTPNRHSHTCEEDLPNIPLEVQVMILECLDSRQLLCLRVVSKIWEEEIRKILDHRPHHPWIIRVRAPSSQEDCRTFQEYEQFLQERPNPARPMPVTAIQLWATDCEELQALQQEHFLEDKRPLPPVTELILRRPHYWRKENITPEKKVGTLQAFSRTLRTLVLRSEVGYLRTARSYQDLSFPNLETLAANIYKKLCPHPERQQRTFQEFLTLLALIRNSPKLKNLLVTSPDTMPILRYSNLTRLQHLEMELQVNNMDLLLQVNLPQLKSFALVAGSTLGPNAIYALLDKLSPTLESLSLPTGKDGKCLELQIFPYCPFLEKLRMPHYTVGSDLLSGQVPNLKVLKVDVLAFTDESRSEPMQNVMCLSLEGFSGTDPDQRLYISQLAGIWVHFPGLKRLVLKGYSGLRGFAQFVSSQPAALPRIEELELHLGFKSRSCSNDVRTILDSRISLDLQRLDLQDLYTPVVDKLLPFSQRKFPKLHSVSFTWHGIMRAEKLIKFFRRFQDVGIRNCCSIRDARRDELNKFFHGVPNSNCRCITPLESELDSLSFFQSGI